MLRPVTFARWLLPATLAICLSCAERGAHENFDNARQAVVGGELSGRDDDGVVLIRAVPDPEPELLCTASLVGPNLLLTARHCVSYFQDGLFNCTVRGEVIQDTEGAGELGLHLPAGSIEVYADETPRSEPIARGLQILSTLSPTICVNDIAFVVLDRNLDLPLIPMRIGHPAELHELTALVGYGMDGKQTKIDYTTQPRKRIGDLEIVGRGPNVLEDGVTTVAPRTLIVDGPSGCVGDSGGPLLSARTGAVLGIYSLQEGGPCTDPDVRHHLTHVPPFEALTREAFAAAGVEPVLEPSDEPTAGQGPVAGAGGSASEPEPMAGGAAGMGEPPKAEDDGTLNDSGCALARPQAGSSSAAFVVALLVLLGRPRRRRATV